jgi:hypothetical protein
MTITPTSLPRRRQPPREPRDPASEWITLLSRLFVTVSSITAAVAVVGFAALILVRLFGG